MTLTDAGTDMSAPLKAIEGNADLPALMADLATRARAAARVLALASPEQKNQALEAMERAIRANATAILAANAEDVAEVRASGASPAFIDRLTVPQARLDAMADGMPTGDRYAVGLLLGGLNGGVDVIVPRGGKSLVARVEAEARVPVFAHLEGVNHVYVDHAANLEMAKSIVLNAKMRRPGVCGAAETLLVDRKGASSNLKPLVEMLIDAGCEVRGDDAVQRTDARVKPASDEDWDTEYEDAIITAKVVDCIDEAMAHIHNHGLHHTHATMTNIRPTVSKFLKQVDSPLELLKAS